MAADVDSELRSLQRTYRSSGFRLSKLEAPAQIRLTLVFECKDPDYRQRYPRQKSLPLEILLPDDYPNDLPTFKVIDGNPEPVHRVITEGLKRFCERKRGQSLMVISALKWLDDNLNGLMSLGCDVVNQEQRQATSSKSDTSKAWTPEQQSQLEMAMKLVPKSPISPDERWRRIAEHVQGKSAEQCVERFKTIRSALQAEAERKSKVEQITANLQEIAFEPAQSAPLPAMEEPKTVSQGVELVFPAIQLINVAMARMRLARFVLRCLRCSSSFDIDLVPTQAQHGMCQKCNEAWSAKFSFEIVHVSNCRFGTVQLANCAVADYLPSDIWISCGRCSSDLLVERVEFGSRKVSANCRECHALMTLICGDRELSETSCLKSVLPVAKAQEKASKKRSAARSMETAELSVVKKGTPLPDFGTCKHYSKSHRWLRFPCCGKAFPCDICHELGTASNPHELKWALRQICGFCSQESAITGTGKCPCGRNTTRASSEFWNGGQGMRDQTRMARNDSRKHAGITKTRSQKHKRVGQKST